MRTQEGGGEITTRPTAKGPPAPHPPSPPAQVRLQDFPTWHINSFVRMFFELQLLLDVVPEQISDLFVVDLKVGRVYEVLHVFAGVDRLEDVLERARNDSSLRSRTCDALNVGIGKSRF